MQKIELLEEEICSEHQVEQYAEHDKLAAGYVHKVLEVAVVDINSSSLFPFMITVKSSVNGFLAGSEHPSDNGMIDRSAINHLRLLILFGRFRFRLFIYRRSFVDE